MKVFVSGQLAEKAAIRTVFSRLSDLGLEITHDWTQTDDLQDYSTNALEAGRRAALDIQGVLEADVYVLMTDNAKRGKGMYVELGAALALAELRGTPRVMVVGPLNHPSIFYRHPAALHFSDIDACLTHIDFLASGDHLPTSQPVHSSK